MSTWQPQLPVLVASSVEFLTFLGQSVVQASDRAKSNQRLAQAVACCRIRIYVQTANSCAAEFCNSPSSHQPIPWRIFLLGLDSPSSSPCSSTICVINFSLTNLQLHKSTLPIYLIVGMAVSTLKHCFEQPAEACTLCTFNTITVRHKSFFYGQINYLNK